MAGIDTKRPKQASRPQMAATTRANTEQRSHKQGHPQSFSMQPSFDGLCPVTEAVEQLAADGGIEERGAVYTKREVVNFILDLVGYNADQPLQEFRLLEPSFGNGDFIIPAVERLLAAVERHGSGITYEGLAPAIRGVELHRETYKHCRSELHALMVGRGIREKVAASLLDAWLIQGDFLLTGFDQRFTHVVGNPPYVRQESVPDALMVEYRGRYSTIYDRADIYIPFIERSLQLLEAGGKQGFICADRWMKNRYGRKLREFVSNQYHLATYVDMVGTEPFHSEVSAYPAITVIERSANGRPGNPTRVYAKPRIDGKILGRLARELKKPNLKSSNRVREVDNIAAGGEPWILEDFDALAIARRLEDEQPAIEDVGCKVGIGVATGADQAFTGEFDDLDVEPCRKLPLAMTRDILKGQVQWRGRRVVNPFGEDGQLVDLADYPKLRCYLEERYDKIAGRHVAAKSPRNWYRTIDRIHPGLAGREKLLIPDIKGDASIVYEGGKLYPHHNLYYVTSDEWNLRALQAVLRSGIARLFVSLYSTRMRGGYLRFQAQYLRRIRLPRWEDVGKDARKQLKRLADAEEKQELNAVVAGLYGLTADEMALVEGGNG